MNFLPNFGDLSAMGTKVSEFIAHAKQMLETVLQGISSLGENQVKSHHAIMEEIAKLNKVINLIDKKLETKTDE